MKTPEEQIREWENKYKRRLLKFGNKDELTVFSLGQQDGAKQILKLERARVMKIIDKIKYCEGCYVKDGLCECGDNKFVVDIKQLNKELEESK